MYRVDLTVYYEVNMFTIIKNLILNTVKAPFVPFYRWLNSTKMMRIKDIYTYGPALAVWAAIITVYMKYV